MLCHDVYNEGLHVDIARQAKPTVHLMLTHSLLPASRGEVIRRYADYFKREAEYFIDVYEECQPPRRPPSWSDGGEPSPRFMPSQRVQKPMSHEVDADADIISDEELTKLLAEAEGRTPKAIERGADEIEIALPEEATVVDE